MESGANKKRVFATFIDQGVEISVPDFCHQFGGSLPQIVRVRGGPGGGLGGGPGAASKDQTFFVKKVSSEDVVAIVVIKKNKKMLGTVCLPLSHPARVCLAKGPKDSPEHTLEDILSRRINPCDVVVCPKYHFKLEVDGKQRTTKDLILHLQDKKTMTSLIGNPVTETSVSEEEVPLPQDCRLRVVTGLSGYPGDWASYLHMITMTLNPHQERNENSRPTPGEYVDMSQNFRPAEHTYEDLKKPKSCVYELVWDAKTGKPVFNAAGTESIPHTGGEGQRVNRHPPNREYRDVPKEPCSVKEETTHSNGGKTDPGEILSDVVSPKIDRNLYYVSWDPETKTPLVNGHVLDHSPGNASGGADIVSKTIGSHNGVRVSEPGKQTASKHVGGYHSLPLPANDCDPSPPSVPPRRPSRGGILISDLPKPVPHQSKSLDRHVSRTRLVHSGRSQSEDMGCGVCLRELVENREIPLFEEARTDRLVHLPTMSVSEITNVLTALKFRCVDKFVEHSIDGSKLLKLADVICATPEFGLSKIEVIKLKKFIQEGYLPKQ